MANNEKLKELRMVMGRDYKLPEVVSYLFLEKIQRDTKITTKLNDCIRDAKFIADKVESSRQPLITRFTRELDDKDFKEMAFDLYLNDYCRISEYFDLYSNKELANLVIKLLDIKDNETIFDLGSGYGTFLIPAAYYCNKNGIKNIKFKGGDIQRLQVSIVNMVAYLAELDNMEITENNYLEDNAPKFDKAYVFPPIGLKNFGDNNKIYFNDGINPRTSLEWVFIDKTIKQLEGNSKAIAILSNKALFGVSDKSYRKYLFENKLVEALIKLPQCFGRGVSLPLTIMILSKNNESVKIIDCSECLIPGEINTLDINKIVDTYNSYNLPTKTSEELARTTDICVDKLLLKPIEVKNGRILDEVSECFTGSQYTLRNFKDQISSERTNFRILQSSDIVDGIIDWDSLPFIKTEDNKLAKFAIKKNDLIITSKSSKVKMAVVDIDPNENIIVTGAMLVVRPNTDKINPVFLKTFLESSQGQNILKSVQRGTIVLNINVGSLRGIVVPCPDIEYQNKMAKKFNARLSSLAAMKLEVQNLEEKVNNFYDRECEE